MIKNLLPFLLLVSSSTFSLAADIKAGESKSAACAGCHGANGNSNLISANPKLAGQHQSYLYKQLKAFKSGSRESAIMQGMVGSLTDEDMQNIAAYFSSKTITANKANGDIMDGQKLYRGGDHSSSLPACSACHGPAGKGNNRAGFPAIASQNIDYIVTQLTAYKADKRKDKMMSPIAAKLSPEQMKSIANYLSALN